MQKEGRWKSFWSRIREKHKLSFTDDLSYDEKWSLNVSSLNLWTLLLAYTILIGLGLFLLFRFTPMKNLLIGSDGIINYSQIQDNSVAIDSLKTYTNSTDLYLNDLKKILNDEPFEDSTYAENDSSLQNYEANFEKSIEDSLLREKIENQENEAVKIEYDFFYSPVKGIISKKFDSEKKHFGIDVVTEKDYPIKASLEGTVIFASWTPEDGHILLIQHKNQYVSVYKHCSSLLKKVGDKVQSGDPVGLVGNTGKHSSGPHLHFELWQNGIPLNPNDFINFNK